jgi:hypothetical protein
VAVKPEKRRRKFSFSRFSPATAVGGGVFPQSEHLTEFCGSVVFNGKKWRSLLNLPNNFFQIKMRLKYLNNLNLATKQFW